MGDFERMFHAGIVHIPDRLIPSSRAIDRKLTKRSAISLGETGSKDKLSMFSETEPILREDSLLKKFLLTPFGWSL